MPEETTAMTPSEVFQKLKALVGIWQGIADSGRALQVAYRLVANDTVLVETWTLAPGREALTLYHMDGTDLMATHYCPIGNQPRLRLESHPDRQKFVFIFDGATNLPDVNMAHQHLFTIELLTLDSFSRSETYTENDASQTEAAIYSRAT